MTGVRFLRVLGHRAARPAVVAVMDDHLVKWNPGPGWTCDCPTVGDTCDHVESVASMLDDRVLGDVQ